MSRRPRRFSAVLLPVVLATALATTLVACGSDSSDGGSSSSSDSLHGITVTGEIGSAPEVKWDGKLDVDKTETTVLTEGDGDEVKDGDKVQVNLWIGNGFTQEEAYSSYADGGQEETVTASDQLAPVFKDAVLGQKLGSRVAVTATGSDAFGESGNTSIGIAPTDTVLIIVDLMKMYEPPTPKDVPSAQLPGIVEKKGEPVALDFKGVAKPEADGDLLRSVVKEGDGKTVTTDMTVTADYLGMVYDAKVPFDESYSKDPVPFALSQVVQGWTYGLEGLKVGSRVLLQIPPSLGYGASEQSGIPANSTLYFVVDIIDAK
ncbi:MULTISPECIES: FKBP-type peptidyl-prolyl cis-trans isomerase [unclassified Nocardioides]|uniref:FKBP-type peptidyl-prolyl cis-trans isomerase n=1 Tax=unclassified Nocardioides TaxID=2615069 RepID=UPI00005714E2|nr:MULTISPECIES: FKBP-type peptidyl-prolyl cis-trans isomerase [unclassified Nocardioides]ABL82152.1 peptidylprolyl isomerase, FKBP-type [Nocardioides sp. JS614]